MQQYELQAISPEVEIEVAVAGCCSNHPSLWGERP